MQRVSRLDSRGSALPRRDRSSRGPDLGLLGPGRPRRLFAALLLAGVSLAAGFAVEQRAAAAEGGAATLIADARRKARQQDVPAAVRLLERVSRVVARKGRLVYSTCSSEPDENEQVVAAFLARAPDFARLPLARLPALSPDIADMATADGYLRTTPLDGLEAFFGAVLERRL